jgi:hypothetical protein
VRLHNDKTYGGGRGGHRKHAHAKRREANNIAGEVGGGDGGLEFVEGGEIEFVEGGGIMPVEEG